MRARKAKRDLAVSLILAILTVWISWLSVSGFSFRAGAGISPGDLAARSVNGDLLTRWAVVSILATGALSSIMAAILAAVSAPDSHEFEAVQSALITRLTPIDVSLGRLLAGIWIPVTITFASTAFWLLICLFRNVGIGTETSYQAVFGAHAGILLFTCAVGSVAFLCSLKRRPGRNSIYGASVSLAIAVLGVTAIKLINPVIGRMDNPLTLIDSALLINPAACVTTAFHLDILRNDWLYSQIQAHDYQFSYPPVAASCTLFMAVGIAAAAAAAARLRRAYR